MHLAVLNLGPNGVILAEFGHTASYVKLTITAVDFGWSLDYIIFRDGAQIASFIYPNYYLPGAQWTDNGNSPSLNLFSLHWLLVFSNMNIGHTFCPKKRFCLFVLKNVRYYRYVQFKTKEGENFFH